MEIILPVLVFIFAIYVLTAGRRAAHEPSLSSGSRGAWAVDFHRGRRPVGDVDLEDLKHSYSQFAAEREGRRLDRAPYEGPRVAYLHRAARAVLSLHVVMRDDGQEDRFTQVAYGVPPGWRHRIEIGPATIEEPPDSPVPGLVRVSTGENDFDHLASRTVRQQVPDAPATGTGEEAQLALQDHLLSALVEKAKFYFEWQHNPLQLMDSFSLKIKNYHPKNLKPLYGFYQTLSGIYRYKYGNNQLEFLWDGRSHFEKYQELWAEAFDQWTDEFQKREQFIQAVLDLTVFLPDNRQAHLAENRMNFVMLRFFSQQDGFPELKLRKTGGVVDMKVS